VIIWVSLGLIKRTKTINPFEKAELYIPLFEQHLTTN